MPSTELVPRPPGGPVATIPAPPWEQPKKASESGILRTFRTVRRNRHLTVPLAVPPVLFLAALILSRLGTEQILIAAAVLATAAVMVWFFAPHKWTDASGKPRKGEVWYARLSALLAAGWLVTAACLGPAGGIAGIVLASVLTAGTGTWGYLWWHHKRPRGQRKRDALIAKWDFWWQRHCWNWNLGGSAIVNVWLMGVTTKLELAGIAGTHTKAHVDQVLPLIESGLDGYVDVGRVRSEVVPGRPNHFYLYLKQANPLAEVVTYDMGLAPRSVRDLAPLGVSETGSWRMVPMLCNSFILGTTRSGKTNHLLVRVASLSGCRDDRQVLIALKGGRSARPVLEAGGIEYVITSVDEARMYFLMLVTETNFRGKYAYGGDDQLDPTEDVPAIHTLVDETHGLTSVTNGDAECARHMAIVASQGSGVLLFLDVDTQYGSLEESVRTEQTRGNLRQRVVFRVEMSAHGQFAFEDWSKLDASRLEEIGTCYFKDGPKSPAEQVRTPHMPHDLLKRITAQNAALMGARPPLRLYCGEEMSPAGMTWQEWWDKRWLRLDPAFREISPQYQAAIAGHPHQAAGILADAAQSAGAPPSAEPGTGDGRSAADRIAAEIDAIPVPDDFEPERMNLAPAMAQRKASFAAALSGAAERGGITPQQLEDESGMSRSWIMQMLRSLSERGASAKLSRGLYVPAPGADIREAIRMVEAGNDQLLAEARQMVSSPA